MPCRMRRLLRARASCRGRLESMCRLPREKMYRAKRDRTKDRSIGRGHCGRRHAFRIPASDDDDNDASRARFRLLGGVDFTRRMRQTFCKKSLRARHVLRRPLRRRSARIRAVARAVCGSDLSSPRRRRHRRDRSQVHLQRCAKQHANVRYRQECRIAANDEFTLFSRRTWRIAAVIHALP